jgi:hypothetical protein
MVRPAWVILLNSLAIFLLKERMIAAMIYPSKNKKAIPTKAYCLFILQEEKQKQNSLMFKVYCLMFRWW